MSSHGAAPGPRPMASGFKGGCTTVKKYVREHGLRSREMFVLRAHAPGHARADFGEAMVVMGGVEQKAHFFALDLPHSDACFVRACPAAVSEAWVDGHVHAFAFFGKVPQSVLYDNDRCLVAKILPDGTRKRTKLFSGFLSHYVIRGRYGRPGKGKGKGKGAVEGLVGYASIHVKGPQLHGGHSPFSDMGRPQSLADGAMPQASGGRFARS